MIEIKRGRTIAIHPDNSVDGKRLEQDFQKRFPRTYKTEKKERDLLREYTSGGIDFPEEIYKPYNFVNGLAIKGGFNEVLINPNDEAKVETFTPFNSLVLPKKYLTNLNDLLSSASPDYPKKVATDGLEAIIRQQTEFKKDKTFNGIIELYTNKEEGHGIYNRRQTIMAEIFEINKQRWENPGSQLVYDEQLLQKDDENFKLTLEEIKKTNEINVLSLILPVLARSQFVEKIKKENRNVVEEIATVVTLKDVLELGVINSTQIEEKKVQWYLEELYPDPILNTQTRNDIIKKGNEIRDKLKNSY